MPAATFGVAASVKFHSFSATVTGENEEKIEELYWGWMRDSDCAGWTTAGATLWMEVMMKHSSNIDVGCMIDK